MMRSMLSSVTLQPRPGCFNETAKREFPPFPVRRRCFRIVAPGQGSRRLAGRAHHFRTYAPRSRAAPVRVRGGLLVESNGGGGGRGPFPWWIRCGAKPGRRGRCPWRIACGAGPGAAKGRVQGRRARAAGERNSRRRWIGWAHGNGPLVKTRTRTRRNAAAGDAARLRNGRIPDVQIVRFPANGSSAAPPCADPRTSEATTAGSSWTTS